MGTRAAAFLEHHPLFAAALMMVGGVALANWMPLVGGLWVVFAATAVGLHGHRWRGLAWSLCGAVTISSFTWRNHHRDQTERAMLAAGEVIAEGRVRQDGMGAGNGWASGVVLTTGPHRGARVWWRGAGEIPVAGAIVRARGRFQPLPQPRNPGEFDKAQYLLRQGVAAVFQANRDRNQVSTGSWAELGARIRHGFRTAITAGLDQESAAAMTIRAVVIGEYPQDGDELVAAFRHSGTLHIFSVSGMHVAMVASIAWLLLRRAGVPRRSAVAVLLALVFGYTWITGSSPPAVRSAWMAAVFLGAFVWRRRPDLLNSLGLVLFVAVLWDGNLLFQPGVQLSYGVVAAIALGTGWTCRWFAWMARPEPYLPMEMRSTWQQRWLDLRTRIAQGLAVSTTAFIGSAPLTAWHFGLLAPISVVATLLLVPLVYVLLGAALLAAAVYPVAPKAAAWLNHGNAWIANACNSTASNLAALPGSHFNLRQNREPMLIVYDLDYGAGAAVFTAGGTGATLLDCGDRYSFKSRLAPSLRRLGITPDSVVLSHPDGLHLGGASQVWLAFPIRQAVLPVKRSLSKTYQAWCHDAPAAGIRVWQAGDVALLPLADDAELEILHVPEQSQFTRVADDRVMVCRLHWRGWRILFTSDAGTSIESALLASGRDLAADVIVAGRHRRDLSLGDVFIDRVGPRAIIAANDAYPPEERLDPQQAAYWKTLGIRVFDQAQTGGVTLRPNPDGNLMIEGFADGSSLHLKPSR